MLSAQLKTQTAAEHAALEEVMGPLMRGATSAAGYATLLRGMYRFLAPLEAGAHAKISAAALPDIGYRRGIALMANDLKALGEGALAGGAGEVPEVKTEADAWGALYLLEGSTLGGQIITRILRKQLPEEAQHLAYFGGYGAQTGSMWKTFKTALDQYGEQQPEQQVAVVRFAKTAFHQFRQMLLSGK